MTPVTLIDTGPLIALLNPQDEYHAWTLAVMRRLPTPLLTSEPVLTETAFLLARRGGSALQLFDLIDHAIIKVGIRIDHEWPALRDLMRKYPDAPMSLADATLVRLSEQHRTCRVLTLDSHFRIYRRHGNKTLPLLMPEA